MYDCNITLKMIKELNDRLLKESIGYIESFKEVKTFNIGEINNIIGDIVSNHKNKCGIYYFEINFNNSININEKNIYMYLQEEWKKDKRINIPPMVKKMIDLHKFNEYIDRWLPFYIGKTQDMGNRFAEHLLGKSTTSGLRIAEIKTGLFKVCSFRLSVIELDEYKDDNYWVVSKIEKNLREKIKPICGK